MYKDVLHKVIYGTEHWRQYKYPLLGRMNKYNVIEYYASIKSNQLHKYTATWIDL